jgi:type I restriction enzyme S subunit
VKLEDILIAHYGKALKKDQRDETGEFEVFGSSGSVGLHSCSLVNHPSIVIGRKGSVGKVIWAPKGGWVIDTAYYLEIKDSEQVDLRYLFYALNSANLAAKTITTSIPGLNRDDFYATKVPLPPINEQKRIAAILDKADAVRCKRQQAIQIADNFLKSVFLDMFGDPVTNPKGWEVKKLKEISSKIASGNTPKGGSKNYVKEGITFLRSQNVWKNKLLLDDVVYIDQKTHESMSKSSLKNKDILMTKTGRINTENSSLGRAALYLGEDGKANLNGHVYFIRLVEDVLHEFVVYILTTKEYRDYIRSVCVGGIDKRQLNKNHLEEFPIIYPSKEMQMQFVEKINITRGMMEKMKVGLYESDRAFNALSQKAFAGAL